MHLCLHFQATAIQLRTGARQQTPPLEKTIASGKRSVEDSETTLAKLFPVMYVDVFRGGEVEVRHHPIHDHASSGVN